MSLVWIYYSNEYKRVSDLDPDQVMLMISNGCEGIKPLINYIIRALSLRSYLKINTKLYQGVGDALVHFVINIGDNDSREAMIVVSRNPADTLFNYYTSSSPENTLECNFGSQ
ncbi:MAG: hypothetical protein ACP5NQ_06670 [Vulcanisaeta sp.]